MNGRTLLIVGGALFLAGIVTGFAWNAPRGLGMMLVGALAQIVGFLICAAEGERP